MAYARDADGFAVPPMRNWYAGSAAPPDFTGAAANGSDRSSGRSLVEHPLYRDLNLAANGVYMRSSREKVPEHIANLLDNIAKDRDSPGPSTDCVWEDISLEELENGAGEPKVEKYFQTTIFPDPGPTDSLERTDKQPMVRHAVPGTSSKFELSTPVPDMLYGYNRHGAFPHRQAQLISMGAEPVANSQGLIYPFFVIEFNADGPSGAGSLWVSTNQCLGGSTSCINITERLNHQLSRCGNDEIRPVNSAAFSIAMSGTEARLYVSWKHSELVYYMQKVSSFLLQEPKQYLEFRKYVWNIIDWGKHRRLKEIRDSLDTILEESSKRASEAAKSSRPPFNGSATSRRKRHKPSSRRNSGSEN